MIAAVLLAVLACAQEPAAPPRSFDELPLSNARDMSGEGRAFVETVIEGTTFYVQQPIRVRLRFGVERPFLEKDMVQLFQHPLDVPVQLQAPWFDALAGTIVRKPAAVHGADASGQQRRLSFAFDERVADGVRVENTNVDGKTFTVLEIETTWLPTAAGDLVVPAPVLRFAYATGFHDDTWNGRVPADRRDAYVRGPAITLSILPLPEAERPADFSGAVGRFAINAEANPRELELGGSLKLTLTVTGEGNLELLEAPRLDTLEGFHVLGTVDSRSGSHRAFVYDLAPDSAAVNVIPSIALAYFDPAPPAAYRAARTRPIPIEVRQPGAADPRTASTSDRTVPALWIGGLIFGSLMIVLVTRMKRRPQDPRPARVYDAALAFTTRTEEPDADLEKAFIDFLAVLLGCTSPAVVGPRLGERLIAAGVPADIAGRAAALLERLTAARFGGKPILESRGSVRAMVDMLERSIQPPATSAS